MKSTSHKKNFHVSGPNMIKFFEKKKREENFMLKKHYEMENSIVLVLLTTLSNSMVQKGLSKIPQTPLILRVLITISEIIRVLRQGRKS